MSIQFAIITEARRWLDTPFHHQGRVKGVGCDCIGLVLGVAGTLEMKSRRGGLLKACDEKAYGRLPDGEKLQSLLAQHLHEIPTTAVEPGDVLLFRFDHNPQHVGLVSDRGIIHCYMQARRVVEHRLDEVWQARVVAAYRFDGV